MTRTYLVQHGEKRRAGSNPGLTDLGHRQAVATGRWLSRHGLTAVYSSPLLRAQQTADAIAAACALDDSIDARLRERMNWDGRQPFAEFLVDWSRTTVDRGYLPRTGDSSHQAASRLRSFLQDLPDSTAPVAVVTHGGVTTDLLRTLLGDTAVPAPLITEGVPPYAITTLDALEIIHIADVDHLVGSPTDRPTP
jgi:broad specificity phosphatase PhoE